MPIEPDDVHTWTEGVLTRAEREAIVVAVSSENRCQYCMVAHGAALRVIGKDPVIAEQIANNWRTADISPRLRAMLVVLLASVAVAVINPNGWAIYLYPLQTGGSAEQQRLIVEWFSPNFQMSQIWAFEAMIFLILGSLALARRIEPRQFVLMVLGLGLALHSVRNLSFFMLVGVPALADYAQQAVERLQWRWPLRRPWCPQFPIILGGWHPSLLPDYPGLRSIERALADRAEVFGVTVHYVDAGIDTGPVILQKSRTLPRAEDPAEVLRALRPLEHSLLPEAVRQIAAQRHLIAA